MINIPREITYQSRRLTRVSSPSLLDLINSVVGKKVSAWLSLLVLLTTVVVYTTTTVLLHWFQLHINETNAHIHTYKQTCIHKPARLNTCTVIHVEMKTDMKIWAKILKERGLLGEVGINYRIVINGF
jgi:hypothetical protein